MRVITRFAALALVGATTAGCSQITVTSDTLVNGTQRIANATTDAVRGTSNATTRQSNSYAQNHEARRRFVKSQYAMLKSEAARGQGEDLDALAYMMQASNKKAFNAEVQSNYAVLFSGDPSANVFLSRLYRTVGVPPDMKRVASAG